MGWQNKPHILQFCVRDKLVELPVRGRHVRRRRCTRDVPFHKLEHVLVVYDICQFLDIPSLLGLGEQGLMQYR